MLFVSLKLGGKCITQLSAFKMKSRLAAPAMSHHQGDHGKSVSYKNRSATRFMASWDSSSLAVPQHSTCPHYVDKSRASLICFHGTAATAGPDLLHRPASHIPKQVRPTATAVATATAMATATAGPDLLHWPHIPTSETGCYCRGYCSQNMTDGVGRV